MLCCNNDAKYVQLLTDAAEDEHTHPRVTLIENVPYASSISDLPFESVVFDNLFDFPAARIDTPLLSRQLSNIKMGDIKEFTPSTAVIAPPVAARPTATTTPAVVKTPAPVATPAPTATPAASPGNLWAAIAAKPAVPITPPPAPAILAGSSTSKQPDGISRNRKGQRIDPPIKHDKLEVERVKKLKVSVSRRPVSRAVTDHGHRCAITTTFADRVHYSITVLTFIHTSQRALSSPRSGLWLAWPHVSMARIVKRSSAYMDTSVPHPFSATAG